MTIRELEAILAKVEDKDTPVFVSVGNPRASEDFEIEDVFTESLTTWGVFILVFTEGLYQF